MPAHAALFTGLLPDAAGLIRAPGGEPTGCRPVLEAQRERLLPSVFGAGGYRTVGVSTNLWLTELSGFATGFDSFHTVDTRRQATMSEPSLRSRLGWIAEGVRARVDDGATEAGHALRASLDEAGRDDRPFFAFVNLVEAHSPYLPPLPYNPLGAIGRARAAAEARRHLTLGAIWRACAGGYDVPHAALERMRALYAASIQLLDDWLARLLEDLDARGILDETIVIVTADHGENLGEGGLMGHAYSLDQRLTHVPFVAAGPLDEPEGVVSLASLPALLAAAAGLETHPYARAAAEPGAAIAQFDPPAAAGDPRVAKALGLWGLPDSNAPLITSPLRSATDGRWKLVRRGETEELFDLEADALEGSPIDPRGEGAAVAPVAALREALAAADAAAVAPAAAAPAGSEEGGGVPSAAADIDDEERAALEERMKLLGYM